MIVIIALATLLLVGALMWVARNKRNEHRHVEAEAIRGKAREQSHLVKQREALADETAADELLITTITHDHADRVRSYELLAREWQTRQRATASG